MFDMNDGQRTQPSIDHRGLGDEIPADAAPAKASVLTEARLPLVELRRADKGNVSPVEMLCA